MFVQMKPWQVSILLAILATVNLQHDSGVREYRNQSLNKSRTSKLCSIDALVPETSKNDIYLQTLSARLINK